MLFELVTVVSGRFISVYGICFIMELFKVRSFNLSWSEKGIMGCSGTIRGAIAFGLSISIQSNKQLNRDILLSTTLSLVFISTVVFGALMPYVIRFFKSFAENKGAVEYVDLDEAHKEEENDDIQITYLHPNYDIGVQAFSKEKNLQKLKKRLSYWVGTYWLEFDDEYVKPKLICNWPEVKKEHDEIAQVIKDVIKDYLEAKKRKKSGLGNSDMFGSHEGKEEHFDAKYETEFLKLQDDKEKENVKKISREEIMNKY